jgi:hypothetical protein
MAIPVLLYGYECLTKQQIRRTETAELLFWGQWQDTAKLIRNEMKV